MAKDNDKINCPNCKLFVSDKKALRCPRCNNPLMQPGCTGSCSKCNMKGKECS